MSKNWKKNFHPRLADALDRVGTTQAIKIDDLEVGDVLELVTQNHRYRLEILDAKERRVRVTSDGVNVTEPTEMYLAGSLLSPFGSMIMVGRVVIGHRVKFSWPGRGQLLLSVLRSIAVNGVPIFSSDDKGSKPSN